MCSQFLTPTLAGTGWGYSRQNIQHLLGGRKLQQTKQCWVALVMEMWTNGVEPRIWKSPSRQWRLVFNKGPRRIPPGLSNWIFTCKRKMPEHFLIPHTRLQTNTVVDTRAKVTDPRQKTWKYEFVPPASLLDTMLKMPAIQGERDELDIIKTSDVYTKGLEFVLTTIP